MSDKPPSLTDAECQDIVTFYGQGWTLADIGRWFGVSGPRIRKALISCGVSRRKTGPRPRFRPRPPKPQSGVGEWPA